MTRTSGPTLQTIQLLARTIKIENTGVTYSQEQLNILSAVQGMAATHPVEIAEKELTDLLL